MSTSDCVEIVRIVKSNEKSFEELKRAEELDLKFMENSLRNDFILPKNSQGQEYVYICGNSLGPQPKRFNEVILEESKTWAQNAVNGHLDNPSGRNWVDWDSFLLEDFKTMVGASAVSEVAINSTLTTNLQNLMIYFYKPTNDRFKIITDAMSFPSDYYVLESQIKLNGFDPKESLIEVQPRDQKTKIIEEEDILAAIKEHGSSVALIMFSGIQYLSGQFFDLKKISKAAREVGALVCFDLAHVIGNVPMHLEDWDVDFAVWCTYKYLNSGPGSVGGFYVNRKHHQDILNGNRKLLAGWWGVDLKKRFLMKHEFEPYEGARAFQQSATAIFSTCGVLASLESFKKLNMQIIRDKSFILTEYFRELFEISGLNDKIMIITPKEKERSGAQISIAFKDRETTIGAFKGLTSLGVVTDRREPDIIRLTFNGLYNCHKDVFFTVEALKYLSQ